MRRGCSTANGSVFSTRSFRRHRRISPARFISPSRQTLAFGPNTHSFVLRLLSCFPSGKPIRDAHDIGSEFMSFARQIARLEEEGRVVVTRIATEPFDSFEARFAEAATKDDYDLVFLSQVFFDSGFAVRDPAKIVEAVREPETFVVIDGYHGFMAVPADISAIAHRAFYLAGGYKYAMAGEGCCFLHCPPGYGARPRDTGWYAGFDALEGGGSGVALWQRWQPLPGRHVRCLRALSLQCRAGLARA